MIKTTGIREHGGNVKKHEPQMSVVLQCPEKTVVGIMTILTLSHNYYLKYQLNF